MALGDLHADSRPAHWTGSALLLAKGTKTGLIYIVHADHMHDLCPEPDRNSLCFVFQKSDDDYVYKKADLPKTDIEEEEEEEDEEEEEGAAAADEDGAAEASEAAPAAGVTTSADAVLTRVS